MADNDLVIYTDDDTFQITLDDDGMQVVVDVIGLASNLEAGDGITVVFANGVYTVSLDDDLSAIAAMTGTGIAVRTGVGSWIARTIVVAGLGLSIANGDGVSANPTISLANDLAALEAMSGTGLVARTASETYAQRTITGTTAEITVTNGNGVSGNPTISLPSAITGTGKTWTGGTFSNLAGVSITPTANTINRGIYITQTSPTSGEFAGPVDLNLINATWNAAATPRGFAAPSNEDKADFGIWQQNVNAFRVNFTVGGANMDGESVVAITGHLRHTSASNQGDKVGIGAVAYSNASDPSGGGLFGAFTQTIAASGSNLPSAVGLEIDLAVMTGATITNRIGLHILNVGDLSVSGLDAAIAISNGHASAGFKVGFAINGSTALDPTGSFFSAGTITLANIFNMSGVTVTGNILNFPHVALSGDGRLTLTTADTYPIVITGSSGSGTLPTLAGANGQRAGWVYGDAAISTRWIVGMETDRTFIVRDVVNSIDSIIVTQGAAGSTVSFTTGAPSPLKIGPGSALTSYNIVSFNGDMTTNGYIGVLGTNAGGDTGLYFQSGAAGHTFKAGGATLANLSSSGLSLGVAGTLVGKVIFNNATSGTITVSPPTGALGTVALTLPTVAGTLAASATAPITLNATTGAIGVTAAALTKTDDTNVTLTLGGSPTTSLLAATSLTLGWTGQLSVARGGTGISSFGTGVATALGVNVGSAGAFVVNGGALGSPSSVGTLPAHTISGAITYGGVTLSNAVTGTGNMVLSSGPTITLANATGLPVAGITASTSTALGVGSVELGHATDTTITRVSAGVIAVEGVNVLLNGGALGSPSSAGTIPAFTLGGTIAGGGNQINNVIIGTTTPLAGSFTTLSATGMATVGPGGTGTTPANLILNGGSGAAGGATVSFQTNGSYKWGFGLESAIIGSGTSADLLYYSYTAGGAVLRMVDATGVIKVLCGVASNSTITGALVVTGGVGISGALYTASGTVTGSDERLKTIYGKSKLGLEFICAIEPIEYRLKEGDDESVHRHGVSAQQVLRALRGRPFNGIVLGDDGMYGANYSEFVAPLIVATQELQKRVAEVERRIAH